MSIQEALQLSSLTPPSPAQSRARKPGRRKRPPTRIALDPDFSHAEHVGHTADGRQFFLTNPYQSTSDGNDGREFLALYLFDRKGILLDAQIDDLGQRSTRDFVRVEALRNERLRSLGKIKHARIEMAPFSVERFGTTFGLVAQEDDDGGWTVVMRPGGSIVFIPPWDSGIYDT